MTSYLTNTSRLVIVPKSAWLELNLTFSKQVHPADFWTSFYLEKSMTMEQVRDLLRFAYTTPSDQKKMVVLFGGDLLSLSVSNALLKLVEEPPDYLSLIIVSETNQLIPTVLSRLSTLEASQISANIIKDSAFNQLSDGERGQWQQYMNELDLSKDQNLKQAEEALFISSLTHLGIRVKTVTETLKKTHD